MNKELLAERQAFKRKAMAVPVVENRSRKDRPVVVTEKKKLGSSKKGDVSAAGHSAKAKLDLAQLKAMGGGSSSPFKFGVLTKIVRHMRNRHMEGEDQPLTLEEILDETHQLDVTSKVKYWLQMEALKNNPKISSSEQMTPEGPRVTYLFKPPFEVRSKKGLLKLLENYDRKGLGGIYLEDLQESLPKCDKIVAHLEDDDRLLLVTRSVDKKKVAFLRETADKLQFPVDEDFRRLWRTVGVEGMDDNKIEEYLTKTGLSFMQDQGERKIIQRKRPLRKKANRIKRGPRDNDHMADVLENYDEMTADAANK